MILEHQVRRVAVLVEQKMAIVVVVAVVVIRIVVVVCIAVIAVIVVELTHVGPWFCLTGKIAVHHRTTTTAAPFRHAIWRICA